MYRRSLGSPERCGGGGFVVPRATGVRSHRQRSSSKHRWPVRNCRSAMLAIAVLLARYGASRVLNVLSGLFLRGVLLTWMYRMYRMGLSHPSACSGVGFLIGVIWVRGGGGFFGGLCDIIWHYLTFSRIVSHFVAFGVGGSGQRRSDFLEPDGSSLPPCPRGIVSVRGPLDSRFRGNDGGRGGYHGGGGMTGGCTAYRVGMRLPWLGGPPP